MKVAFFIFLVLKVVFVFSETLSENPGSVEIKTTPAILIHKQAPMYPRKAYSEGKEGWVILSFVVDREGEVVDPIVVDSSGSRAFERPSLAAVKEWKYSPAVVDGELVEQCHTRMKMVFEHDREQRGVSNSFRKKLQRISSLISKGDLTKAKKALHFLSISSRRIVEDAWFWFVSAEYYKATGNSEKLLESLNRAVAYDDRYLPLPNFIHALKNMYLIEIKLGYYPEALRSASWATKYMDDFPSLKKMIDHSKQLEAQLSQTNEIPLNGIIGRHGNWAAELIRYEFSFDYFSDEVDKFELRCDLKRQSFDVKMNHVWSVPKSWGKCTIVVFGDVDADFRFSQHLPGQL